MAHGYKYGRKPSVRTPGMVLRITTSFKSVLVFESYGGTISLGLLFVSLFLDSAWSGVVLVHFTFLFVLCTTYILWYTKPVLRSYLLFIVGYEFQHYRAQRSLKRHIHS